MADFVNRRLIPDQNVGVENTTPQQFNADYLGLMGTLDAAIHKTSQSPGMLNHQLIFGEDPVTFTGTRLSTKEAGYPDSFQKIKPADWYQLEALHSVPSGYTESALEGFASYLQQSDILTHLGPHMTPRSDTFTIRAYGETKNRTGKVTATARCEAVVQRVAEPAEPGDNIISPQGPSGRKFTIVNFRWINE